MTRPTRESTGIILVVFSAVSFGGVAPLAKLAFREGALPMSLLATRFTVAALAALALLLVTNRWRNFPRGRELVWAIGIGLVGYWATAGLFFIALRTIPAGVASVLLFTNPIPVTLIAWLVFKERPSMALLIAIAFAIPGVALLTLTGEARLDPAGTLAALGAGLTYAATIIAARRAMNRADADPETFTTVVLAGAALGFVATALAIGEPLAQPTVNAWAFAIALGVFSTALSIILFFQGVKYLSAPKASVISTLEPLATVALGYLILDERLRPLQVAGGVLVLAAVVLLTRRREAIIGGVE